MAGCAVALDGRCLRMPPPPESLDVTKLAQAFVTLARPRRGVPVAASIALRGPGGEPPYTARRRWPPRACRRLRACARRPQVWGRSLRAARPPAADRKITPARARQRTPAGDDRACGVCQGPVIDGQGWRSGCLGE